MKTGYRFESDGPGCEGKVDIDLDPAELQAIEKLVNAFNTAEENNHHSAPWLTIKRII